jgi:hypothetical protein
MRHPTTESISMASLFDKNCAVMLLVNHKDLVIHIDAHAQQSLTHQSAASQMDDLDELPFTSEN